MDIRPRDVIVSYYPHEEGKPHVVKLHHKPTSISAEGRGSGYDEAKANAQKDLETLIEVAGAASC